jgi:hypothetical protein
MYKLQLLLFTMIVLIPIICGSILGIITMNTIPNDTEITNYINEPSLYYY